MAAAALPTELLPAEPQINFTPLAELLVFGRVACTNYQLVSTRWQAAAKRRSAALSLSPTLSLLGVRLPHVPQPLDVHNKPGNVDVEEVIIGQKAK
jgi:hypothetical protein